MIRRTPFDVLQSAIVFAFVGCVDPRKPGAIIQKLPKSDREILTELRPSDVQRIRLDWGTK